MSGDMQLELWLHEYKMDALSSVLEEQGSSVEKPMQEMLIDLYAELVPHEVQQEIRTRIDTEYAAEQAEKEAARKYTAFCVRENGEKSFFQDHKQAYRLFVEEALGGNALAMHDLGRMLADGVGIDADAEQSRAWYAKALSAFQTVERQCPNRYVEYRIGRMYASGLGTEQDDAASAKWFSQAAAQGYQYAQYSLAGLYSKGRGVPQDDGKALELYTLAAAQGFPYAVWELGKRYRDGTGCAADERQAARYFSAAYDGFRTLADQRPDDRLQYRIGWMLLRGVGTERDESGALEWLGKSAELKNPYAEYQVAKYIMAAPSAKPEKVDQAVDWLTHAAESGLDYAQYALGKLYRDGGPVAQDMTQAVIRFSQAA